MCTVISYSYANNTSWKTTYIMNKNIFNFFSIPKSVVIETYYDKYLQT